MKCVLKDLIEYSKDGEWGKDQPSDESEEMLCVRGTDFESARFGNTEKVPRRFIAQRHADRKRLQPWDVLIEAAGGTKDQPTGRTVLLKPSVFRRATLPLTCASFSRLIRFRTDLCDPAFMFWYLQSLYHSDTMRAYHTQHTGVARFQWTTFAENEPLQIPDLPTQRRIAGILSAYDDMIENNLRRIRILEEMAQSLYREWFVHFRFPGHESVPLVDSPLGPIPEGWEVRPVEELLDSHIGGGWGKDVADDKHTESAFVIRGTDIPDARLCCVESVPFRYHSVSNLRSRKLQAGDIVFEVSGGSKGQPVGRSLFVTDRLLNQFRGEDVMCASFCKLLRPRADYLLPELLLYHLLEIYEDGRIDAYQVQSTGITNFKFAPFLEQEGVIVPPASVQTKWRELSGDFLRRATLLGVTNVNLRQTRDLLLPKLLSTGQ